MKPVAEEALRSHDETLRALAPILAAHREALIAHLPQYYTLEQLSVRYCLPRDQVGALLTRHGMYTPRRGVSARIHIDNVLRLDNILRRGLE